MASQERGCYLHMTRYEPKAKSHGIAAASTPRNALARCARPANRLSHTVAAPASRILNPRSGPWAARTRRGLCGTRSTPASARCAVRHRRGAASARSPTAASGRVLPSPARPRGRWALNGWGRGHLRHRTSTATRSWPNFACRPISPNIHSATPAAPWELGRIGRSRPANRSSSQTSKMQAIVIH